MKNYTKIFAPLIFAILIGSLTFIFAQTKDQYNSEKQPPPRSEVFGHKPPGMRGGLPPHIIEQLNLTDAQKEQIQSLELSSRDSSKVYFDIIRTSDEQLRSLSDSGNFSETGARQILNTKSQALIEMEIIRLRTDDAILKILTAEQTAQLEKLKQQHPPMPPPDGFRPNK